MWLAWVGMDGYFIVSTMYRYTYHWFSLSFGTYWVMGVLSSFNQAYLDVDSTNKLFLIFQQL